MYKHLSPFPAMVLFRSRGTILYANSPAHEHAGKVTGATLASFGTLDGLLAKLFSTSQAGAAASLTRALRLAKRRGNLRLRIALPGPGNGPRIWDVCLAPRRDQPEETYQLSFQPSGTEDPLPNPRVHILHSCAGHARQILDQAMEVAAALPGEGDEKIDLMLGLIRRARGLLATLEGMPLDAFNPSLHPTQEVG